MKRKYESEMMQVLHEDMMSMHEDGIISDAEMRKFDEMCLVKEPQPAYESEKPAVIVHATA